MLCLASFCLASKIRLFHFIIILQHCDAPCCKCSRFDMTAARSTTRPRASARPRTDDLALARTESAKMLAFINDSDYLGAPDILKHLCLNVSSLSILGMSVQLKGWARIFVSRSLHQAASACRTIGRALCDTFREPYLEVSGM